MEEVGPISTELPDGRVMVSGRTKMIIPQGGKHVRQAEVRIIPPVKVDAVVTATVVAPGTVGTVFSLYGVQLNDFGDQTQLAFSATNVAQAIPSDDVFFCSYIVVGEPKGP